MKTSGKTLAASPTRGRGAEAGFTLIELIVVLAIMAMAVSVALIGLRGSSATRLTPFAAQLSTELKQARTRAILSGRPVAFLLDPQARTYRVEGSAPAKLPADIAIAIRSADRNAMGRVDFYPDGSSSGGSVIVSLGSASVALDVEWLTGAIRKRSSSG